MSEIRNVAIIAHVDHGKTTLVDALLRQSATELDKTVAENCILDSNDLERERGITIFSKNASVVWRGIKINIIDTPGHADFGGEVERVLSMADGALLLIDAKDGPMPQTRFVLKQALARGLKIIVVINKIDQPAARPAWALDQTFNLFVDLGASDEQANFPVIYAAGRRGLAGTSATLETMADITPLFEAMVREVPPPAGDPGQPFQFSVTSVMGDQFRGRLAIGRIYRGTVKPGDEVARLGRGGLVEKYRLTAVLNFVGLKRLEVTAAVAGDIVALAGHPAVTLGETIATASAPETLPALQIEEPTVKMTFRINDSPLAGQEGTFTTSRQVGERLMRERENDPALIIADSESGSWEVAGRGELHLAILIERLRREGYEFQVSRPQVIPKMIDGAKHVPHDQLTIEVPEEYLGVVVQKLGQRQGEMKNMVVDKGLARLDFVVPTGSLFGYRREFLTDTRGLGVMHSTPAGYSLAPSTPSVAADERGSLVASESGQTLAYGLLNVQDRGVLFYGPGAMVYVGQVVGEHSRAGDLRVNVCKAKQLSNVRSRGEGVTDHLNAPRPMGLDEALEYIGDDELVEVTPVSVRIRKIILDEAAARRLARGIK
ncbi:MAG: translational GTPase TypA [Patescibacteria group bacterium]